ncbi:hypothetical protein LCGC14_0430290 [marine sediment metagenome]|uniref:Uncharacterized protein n=1 Tax=marine sediment metagenome TaxID=412755 RepID=A0A0F9VXZ6_9ZZZZ
MMIRCQYCGHDLMKNDLGGNCAQVVGTGDFDQPELFDPCQCCYHQPEDQMAAIGGE